jgi:hypothetical protein
VGAPLVELLFAVVAASVVLVAFDGDLVQVCINKFPSPSCPAPARPTQICSALFFFASPPLQIWHGLPLSTPRVEVVIVNQWLFRCLSSLNALTPHGLVLDFAIRQLLRRDAFPWVVPCSSLLNASACFGSAVLVLPGHAVSPCFHIWLLQQIISDCSDFLVSLEVSLQSLNTPRCFCRSLFVYASPPRRSKQPLQLRIFTTM